MAYVISIAILGGFLAVLTALLLLARDVLVPVRPCTIDVNDGQRTLNAETAGSLLEALYNEEIFIPSACGGQGTCGYCKVAVPSGGGPVLPTETPYLTPDELPRSVRLACQVRLRGDVHVRIAPELLELKRYRALVADAEMLTRDTRRLALTLADPERMSFRAGQYVQVEVPADDGLALRAYSISSPQGQCGAIELVVRLVPGGLGSTWLHRVRPGDTVWLTGPYGDFRISDEPDMELVCVAGGCGLAPIRSLVHSVLHHRAARACWVFVGCRTPQDALYRDELRRLADEHDTLRVIYAVSGATPGRTDWDGDCGLIHTVVDRHLPDGARRQAFLCGPEEMVQAASDVLIRKGVPARSIHCDAL